MPPTSEGVSWIRPDKHDRTLPTCDSQQLVFKGMRPQAVKEGHSHHEQEPGGKASRDVMLREEAACMTSHSLHTRSSSHRKLPCTNSTWRSQGLNPGSSVCKAAALPLSYSPSPELKWRTLLSGFGQLSALTKWGEIVCTHCFKCELTTGDFIK